MKRKMNGFGFIILLMCSSLALACDGDKADTVVVEENGGTEEQGGNGNNGKGNAFDP
ncbi:MAG: hypothetical protein LBQ78_01440 [Tannerellaceae bacterium]|nr:hypothetical protein [Tannerellaceae bacterium]